MPKKHKEEDVEQEVEEVEEAVTNVHTGSGWPEVTDEAKRPTDLGLQADEVAIVADSEPVPQVAGGVEVVGNPADGQVAAPGMTREEQVALAGIITNVEAETLEIQSGKLAGWTVSFDDITNFRADQAKIVFTVREANTYTVEDVSNGAKVLHWYRAIQRNRANKSFEGEIL